MAGEGLGKGTQLLAGNAATPTEVFTAVAGVTGIDVPAYTFDEIDVTALDSAAKEFLLGLGDGGELPFSINLRRKAAAAAGFIASQQVLEDWSYDGGVLHNFKIVLPAPFATSYAFSAFVKQFKVKAPGAGQVLTADVVLRLSGAITRA